MGIAVGAGTAVGDGPPPVDGMAVGAMAVGAMAVGAAGIAVGDAGTGVAVAEEPQATIAASSRANGPRITSFGFFNKRFSTD
ncbi:MAG: hypothetical protein J4N87_01240 [Chloroflexi bacterium]|nr:hypothetical protein [Chloroflexota bacterium]